MTQRLYDTRQQTNVDFTPLRAGEISMYVCGPTVQSSPHVGHLRSALVYDQIRRWFTHEGYRVTLVRNVTDIDDKTLANATEHEPWWALAYRIEREFNAAYATLRIQPPTYEPRATGAIPEMQAIIARLIDRGHAYVADDGVYFDTASWADYGELTHQQPRDMVAAEDGAPRAKRSAQDFALWKGKKTVEPESAAWDSPWGPGRPGWHIECSAMSTKYLGTEFDIHGGGRDLRFPHHENELAQSRAAGDAFARHWLHNGLVSLGGTKMSKSIGNVVSAGELLENRRAIVVRYLFGSAHYRSTIELSDEAYAESAAAFERIENFLERAARLVGEPASPAVELPDAFVAAMRDDFGVPQALAVVHESVTAGNQALEAADATVVGEIASSVRGMLGILGVDPQADEWADSSASDSALEPALDSLITGLLEQRAAARAARDWEAADRIRDALAAAGISIEDTPQGSHWSV
ncbi:cysteine--tRNA ligase [Gulosibacter molinativorax]|uniref:Cysteine--tRNA ligase n=1 Tax=Gulosibacter molinativorax TaxID=256821 RepID=A0ABT7C3Y8_9MICO|nr:cysteine--tRNA ligase [Gulosibacter molinativorax]MDJ1369949.1 cysteine--tRNA ligase [Gulosibacter molinativorax]